MRIGREHFCDDRLDRIGGNIRGAQMERAHRAFAFNQRHNGFLWWRFLVCPILRSAADEGLVSFNEFTFAAHAAGELGFAHPFADTHGHEPCRSVGAESEHAPELVGRNALFTSAEQVGREQPLVKWDMRSLVDGADCSGKRLLESQS
jgi:hypothetical protein